MGQWEVGKYYHQMTVVETVKALVGTGHTISLIRCTKRLRKHYSPGSDSIIGDCRQLLFWIGDHLLE